MKRLLFVVAIAILVAPFAASLRAQDDFTSVDLSSILNQGGNNNGNRGNNRGPQIPDSKQMFVDIQAVLKKGKTPLEKAQEKPLQSLLDTEIVALTDKIQLLRNNNNTNNNNNNQPANTKSGGTTNQPSETAIKVETITSLKNDDFLSTKLSLFLTPEQAAAIQKAHTDDKNNSTCLGGLLDRYYNQLQNSNRGNNNNQNRGNNNNNYNNNNNNNNNNSQTRPNGMKYCMTQEATPADRLEPIRKVLAKANMPLSADKNQLAEIVMKSQLQDLETALKAGLTSNNNNNFNNNRGNNNRNNDPRQIIQSGTDNIFKKIEAMLKPEQAETVKMYHYTQMLERNPIDALIAVNAMADTPLSDEQITKVTAAWPEYQRQIEDAARAAKQQITQKQREKAAMTKILDMLDSSQVASYKLAIKYGPETLATK